MKDVFGNKSPVCLYYFLRLDSRSKVISQRDYRRLLIVCAHSAYPVTQHFGSFNLHSDSEAVLMPHLTVVETDKRKLHDWPKIIQLKFQQYDSRACVPDYF